MLFSKTPEDVLWDCIEIYSGIIMKKDIGSPKDADLGDLWAHLKVKYRDGDEIADEDGNLWDIWRKGEGYVLYCLDTKEVIEVPKPKKLGG